MSEYAAGQLIDRGGKPHLVTRIVTSNSFFEDRATGECYVLDEYYLEFLDEEGQSSFLTLSEKRHKVEKDPECKFPGPDTLEWRKISG